MTPAQFAGARARLGLSRRAFCARLGIAPNSGTAYELGRQPIPRVVALATAALLYGLPPVGGEDQDTSVES